MKEVIDLALVKDKVKDAIDLSLKETSGHLIN
jgi:hypothetical protein